MQKINNQNRASRRLIGGQGIRIAALSVLLSVGAVALLASRNSSGTYSITASGTYPFVSGTAISSTTMNSIFSDLATETTDSLSRSGKGGMLAPMRTVDGTVTAPAWSFTNETGSGLYRIGSHDFGMSVNQSKVQEWTATGTSVTGTGAISGNTTVGGTLGVTGAATLSSTAAITGTTTVGAPGSNTAVDITMGGIELTGASQALIDFKDSYGEDYDARIIKISGQNLTVAGTPLTVLAPVASTDAATKGYVDARFVLALRAVSPSGSSCGTLYQTGTITATCVRNTTGSYTVTVTGLTANGIVTATAQGSQVYASVPTVTTNSFTVFTTTAAAGGTQADSDFSCVVFQL